MTAIESDTQSSVITEECQLHWGDDVSKELQEEATLVSNLALDLFQKLKVHPNVYVPCNKSRVGDWVHFLWTNNFGQFGTINLNRDIENKKGKKKEIPFILIHIFHKKDKAKSPYVNTAKFSTPKGEYYSTMPVELRKETENLIKVSSVFFRKLVEHPDVIVMDGGNYFSEWETFRAYDEKGKLNCKIAFSDQVDDSGDRIQKLLIRA